MLAYVTSNIVIPLRCWQQATHVVARLPSTPRRARRAAAIPNRQGDTQSGDCLLIGKPCRYVPNQLGQLSLSSLRGRLLSTGLGVWLRFKCSLTCVG